MDGPPLKKLRSLSLIMMLLTAGPGRTGAMAPVALLILNATLSTPMLVAIAVLHVIRYPLPLVPLPPIVILLQRNPVADRLLTPIVVRNRSLISTADLASVPLKIGPMILPYINRIIVIAITVVIVLNNIPCNPPVSRLLNNSL